MRLRGRRPPLLPSLLLPVLCLFGLSGGSPAAAGEGELVDGRLDLLVYFAYDEDEPAVWEPVFTEYSKLLSNATEGGVQLGTVRFTTCAELMDQADIWVLDDFSGARAHLNGLGVPGRHMTISQLHESTGGSALGQFGLAHETGHYVWGVYDEYRGYIGDTPGVHFAHYCVSAFGTVACLMDGGTTVFPNHLRTEFCTEYAAGFPTTRHFPGTNDAQGNAIRTDQEYLLARSCWQRIEDSGVGNLSHPLTDPSVDQPPHADVVFDYSRYVGSLGMAVVLDTSGSMDAEGKLAQAILGAGVGVGLLRDGEFLTIVGFADAPDVVYPVRAMNDSRKGDALEALATLTAEGGTVIGPAVLEAVDQLAGVEGGKEFLVLVTDGISDDPDVDDVAVLAALQAGNHALFAIALGAFPDDESLLRATEATGGQYFRATDSSDLPGIFATIFAIAGSGTSVAEDFAGELGGFLSRAQDFTVSESATGARVTVSHEPGADMDLSLVAPDGTLIEFAAPPSGVEVFGSAVQKTMRVADPAPGTWRAVIAETQGATVTYDLLAFVESAELNVTTGAAAGAVVYPDPMQVEVSVVARVPVGGVDVTATVLRPDDTRVAAILFDDGLAVHGDAKRDDGVYSALFTSYAGDGRYVFEFDVENVNGGSASNQECGWYGRAGAVGAAGARGTREEGQGWDPIAPFTARARHVLLLTGQAGGVETGTATLLGHAALDPAEDVDVVTSPPTPVAGGTVEVSSDEPLRWDRLVVDLDPGVQDVAVLDGMALHIDGDGDGELDVPSIPVGVGHLSSDERQLVFTQTDAPLAVLAAGEAASFLLTLGQAQQGTGAGRVGAGSPPRRLAGRRASWEAAGWGLLLLACLALLRRRSTGTGARGGGRRVGVGPAGLVLAGMAILGPACTGGGGAGDDEAIGLRIAPGSFDLTGGVTEAPVLPSGDDLEFRFHAR